MKLFLIFSVICLAGVNGFLRKKESGKELNDIEKKVLAQCALELNFDASKYTQTFDLNAYAANPVDETTCMMACSYRSLIPVVAPEILPGSDGRETLYNGLMWLIDEAFKFHMEKEPTEYSREDIAKKVEQCYASEPTECGFFKCVEFYKPPYSLALARYFAKTIHDESQKVPKN